MASTISTSPLRSVFSFPNPVNETSARLVAAGAVLMALGVVAGQTWLLVPLAYGFVARVLAGPRFSPLGLLATKVLTPAVERTLSVEHRFVAGAPKRFAQGIGATLTVAAAIAHFGFGATVVAQVLVGMLAVAAFAEAALAYCLGCVIFGGLMRTGVIPERICAECNDISARLARRAAQTR